MNQGHRLLWFVVLLGSVGCSEKIVVCGGTTAPAINVTVVDSISGEALTTTATVFATSKGDTIPALFRSEDDYYPIGLGLSGVFSVFVRAAGYADWSVSGVNVTANSCGIPTPVLVTAKLQPKPSVSISQSGPR